MFFKLLNKKYLYIFLKYGKMQFSVIRWYYYYDHIIREKERDVVNLLEKITEKQIRKDIPEFQVGDNVRVDLKIKEIDSKGNTKTRIQAFEGLVMAIKGSGVSKTFTVRKVSGNVGAEKTLPVNSPVIDKITITRKGKVRRAKLGYIRNLKKTPKIPERN